MRSFKAKAFAAALVAAFLMPADVMGQGAAIYNANPPTFTDKQQSPLQIDVNGNVKTIASAPAPPRTGTGGLIGGLSVTTTAIQIAPAATRTARLWVKNESTSAPVAICFAPCTPALATSGSISIPQGATLILSSEAYIPGDAIMAIAGATPVPVTVWSK